jgi:ribonucleoside-diphosphate reductase alpha chain
MKNKVNIDLERDGLFDDLGLTRLRESYMREDESSPQERFAYVCEQFGSNPDHAQRLYEYTSKHWLSLSTPILSYGRSKRGMPISCFLSYLDDSAEGLVDTLSEVNWLSMLGGGVGIHVGIRGSDDKSVGVMPHLKVYDASSLAYRQGRTRRGSYAAFLDINHPDITAFVEMRKPTGDQNFRTLNLHHGVNITNDFMNLIEQSMRDEDFDDSWDLVSPNNGEVVETVSAKALWIKLLEMRTQTGEPYLVFIDNANDDLPEWLKSQGLKINGSNLCTEIFLPTSMDRTAVCCLSSLNIEYYDEWKSERKFIPDIMEMLDNVLDHFIEHAPKTVSRAALSASRERSIGIGTLGLHAYFQKRDMPLEGVMTKVTNREIYRHIEKECKRGDRQLFESRGPCYDAQQAGVERRFSHWTAIAPNASSSIIMGNTSPSIEPYRANVFRQDTMSGAYIQRNKFLETKLEELGLNTQKTWASITAQDGSVQHLDIPQDMKDVFKTANEIDQLWLIDLASDRQKHTDQGQSLNLFFRPDVNVKYLHATHFLAWKNGLKSLYYCRSDKLRKADRVGMQIQRNRIEDEIDLTAVADGDVCLACEG